MKLTIKTLFLIYFIVILLFFYLAVIILTWRNIQFDDIKMVSLLSWLLFLVISVIGLKNERLYFLFLPFILIAFPSPINYFFPGHAMGPSSERGNSIFPIFMHIDLYFFVGLLRSLFIKRKLFLFHNTYIYLTIFLLAISFFVNSFCAKNNSELLLLLSGSYQIRYLLMGFFVLSMSKFEKYQDELLLGFIGGVVFLFLESFVNYFVDNGDRLSSGTLGMNTFGNTIAAIMVFLFFIKKLKKKYLTLINVAIILCFILIIGTKNRISLIATFCTFFIVKFYIFGNFKAFLKASIVLSLVVGVSFQLFAYMPNRFNPIYLKDKIE